MPIPTRSIFARDSRKQPANGGCLITKRTTSASTTTGDEIPPKNASSNDNALNKHRNLPAYDTRLMGRQQESRLSQRTSKPLSKGQVQQQDGQNPTQDPPSLTRRQSLARPSQLKASSSRATTIPTTNKRVPVGRGPPSPLKQEDSTKHNGRSLSPRKLDMPPPQRPARSASLRQTASSSSGAPAGSRGHVRHRSQVVVPPSTHVSKKTETPQTSGIGTTRLRTQFTTFQHQFSPKKAPNPSVIVAPRGTTRDLDLSLIPSSWPEIAALQTELLQMSLLRGLSLQQALEWEVGAESQLRSKYDSVAGGYRAILDVEKESQRRLNAYALNCWLKNTFERTGKQRFAEQIQILSQVAQGLNDFNSSPQGRYTMVVGEFEAWLEEVEIIRNSRPAQTGILEPGAFIDPLPRSWKEEMRSMVMKLEFFSSQLQSLDILGYDDPEVLRASAIFRIAKGLEDMTRLMIDELNAIRKIEVDLVKSENTWVRHLANEISTTHFQEERVSRVGMWRRPSLIP